MTGQEIVAKCTHAQCDSDAGWLDEGIVGKPGACAACIDGALQRLHRLVAEARSYIDPDEHAEWDAAALAETLPCDQAIDERDAARAALSQREGEVMALREALAALLSLHDDPCPYDAATTRARAREVLSSTAPVAKEPTK